jgi:hypothetical protein
MTYFVSDGRAQLINQVKGPAGTESQARDARRFMRDLQLELDGYAVPNLSAWLIDPVAFETQIPPAPNYFSCPGYDPFEGQLTGYVVGAFALLPAPPSGRHRLRYGGTLSIDGFDIVTDVTTWLDIE